MALAVLTLGAVTVVTMQKATLMANTNARNLAAASDLAQSWMERLRVDALAWNDPATVPDITSDTAWLRNSAAPANPGATGWFTPAVTLAGSSNVYPAGAPMADIMAADLNANDPAAPAFCVQVRLTQYGLNTSLWALSRLVRAEVRVFWDKTGNAINCTISNPGDLPTNYGSVYLVSGVLENNSPI